MRCLRGCEKCMGAIVVLRWRAGARTYGDRGFAEWRHGSEGSVAATQEAGSTFERPARGVSAAEAVRVQVPIATLR